MKKTIRWLHLVLGLTSGLVVFTVSITGSVYAFEEEFRALIHHDLYKAERVGTATIGPDSIVALVNRNYPNIGIKNMWLPNDAESNVEVMLKNKTFVFVNPYNGKIAGTLEREKEFFTIVLKIHRNLYLGEKGKIITGVSALVFLFMILSGIILWWPPRRRMLKQKLRISAAFGKPRLFYDLHQVLGFYASWVLIFSVLTGLVFSFKWFEKATLGSLGMKKQEKYKSSVQKNGSVLSLNAIATEAQEKYPGAQNFLIAFPEKAEDALRLSVETDKSGLMRKNDHYFYDTGTGRLLASRLYKDMQTGDVLRANNERIHTGKMFGLAGQLIVFFASLIAASLPVTGFMHWRYKSRAGR